MLAMSQGTKATYEAGARDHAGHKAGNMGISPNNIASISDVTISFRR